MEKPAPGGPGTRQRKQKGFGYAFAVRKRIHQQVGVARGLWVRVPQRVPERESESCSGLGLAYLLISRDLGRVVPPLASIYWSVKWDDGTSDTRVKLKVFCMLI